MMIVSINQLLWRLEMKYFFEGKAASLSTSTSDLSIFSGWKVLEEF